MRCLNQATLSKSLHDSINQEKFTLLRITKHVLVHEEVAKRTKNTNDQIQRLSHHAWVNIFKLLHTKQLIFRTITERSA